ncbi:MAG TPA: M48 family metalloprotease [Thermoanaerobaculia bacterium]
MSATNLYEQQKRNRERTAVFLAAIVLFLTILGLGADGFLYGAGGSPGVPICTIGALAFGGLSAWWALSSGDRAILESATARPLNPADPAERALDNVVEEMAIAAGIPKPSVYVIPDSDPNAFATGPGPARASIAVTRGTLDALNREELQGVVAHEMSHVRNLDIRLMTVVAALAGAILLVADASRRGLRWGGGRAAGRREGRSGLFGIVFFVLWVVSLLLAPLVARLVALALSREREYLADASGAELTRNPLALASALEKIDAAVAPTPSIKQGVAQLCIADPLGRPINERSGAWASLFSTHPPIARRIALLRAMAYAKAPAP